MNNQLDTSEEKLQTKHARGIIFGYDGDTTTSSPSADVIRPAAVVAAISNHVCATCPTIVMVH
jgi:hypothetical protein